MVGDSKGGDNDGGKKEKYEAPGQGVMDMRAWSGWVCRACGVVGSWLGLVCEMAGVVAEGGDEVMEQGVGGQNYEE